MEEDLEGLALDDEDEDMMLWHLRLMPIAKIMVSPKAIRYVHHAVDEVCY